MSASQPELFALPPAKRIALDATSWVELLPGWLHDADAVFAHLLRAAPWVQRERRMFERMVLEPRMTAEMRELARAPHRRLVEAANALSDSYGVRYDHLWLNLYRDGSDSTAWHGDKISCRRAECIVPVLTLGATRRFLLKPRSRRPLARARARGRRPRGHGRALPEGLAALRPEDRPELRRADQRELPELRPG